MAEDASDRPWIRWVLAAGAAVLTVSLLGVVIGAMVPRRYGEPPVGGVSPDELTTVCRLVSGEDAMLCQRLVRVDAALDDGNCKAAEIQARPILALREGDSPLRDKLRAYVAARMAVCATRASGTPAQ